MGSTRLSSDLSTVPCCGCMRLPGPNGTGALQWEGSEAAFEHLLANPGAALEDEGSKRPICLEKERSRGERKILLLKCARETP